MEELQDVPLMTQIQQTMSSSSKNVTDLYCSYKQIGEYGVLIRYEAHVFVYEGGEHVCTIYRNTYPIIRKTAKCDVIDYFGKERFVLRDAHKRFAYPTDDLAVISLEKRTRWRLSYAHNTMQRAELAKEMVSEFVKQFNDEQVREEGETK